MSSPWIPGDYQLTPGYSKRQPRPRGLTPGQRHAAIRWGAVLAALVALLMWWETILAVLASALVLVLVVAAIVTADIRRAQW